MASSVDPHLRAFQASITSKIVAYGEHQTTEVDFIHSQKQQVVSLSKLEEEFRKQLISSPEGKAVYVEFINFIINERKNILDARPYFRIRQAVFTRIVSPALRSKNPNPIYKCHFNYLFAKFAIDNIDKEKFPELNNIFKKIHTVRNKLIEVNVPLAIARASVFFKKTKRKQTHLTRMDLIQTALEGLTNGVDKFCGRYDNVVYRHMIIGRITGSLILSNSIDQDTVLNPIGELPKKIKDFVAGDRILGIDNLGNVIETEVLALHDHGSIDGYEVEFDDGYKIVCSKKHKFLTEEGQIPIQEIWDRGLGVYNDQSTSQEKFNALRTHGSNGDTCVTQTDMRDLLSFRYRRIEGSMEDSTFAHAPLAATGNLSLRKVVRFSPVGKRRMYDLEVSHPKHNFLLTNGIVTSNSSTMVHYYPLDKRKLYNANKVMHKCRPDDFLQISEKVNDIAKEHHYSTTPEELSHILAASDLISADLTSPLTANDRHTKTIQDTILYADAEDSRPDKNYESAELSGKLAKAMKKLTILEQKILKMKGLDL